MPSHESNMVAADLLKDHGFFEQADLLMKLNEIDMNRSIELAVKCIDVEDFFDCLLWIFEDLDLQRVKQAVSELDAHELASVWYEF